MKHPFHLKYKRSCEYERIHHSKFIIISNWINHRIYFRSSKTPVPAPNALVGIVGILGITLGYLLFNRLF